MAKSKIKQKAGVVAYRQTETGQVEILVVSARKYPDAWLFPVGTVEPGETPAQAAIRECREESGYQIEIGPLLAKVDLPKNGVTQSFTFFTARVVGEVEDYEKDRQRRWVSPAELLQTVSHVFAPVAQAAMAIQWSDQAFG
jgi:ADP-ribose pyrophosphatase YjhB (NUDIX family)